MFATSSAEAAYRKGELLWKCDFTPEEAARCGVAVLASAHGSSFDALAARPCLRSMLDGATFGRVMLLGPRPGAVREVWRREWKEGMPVWTRE